jgi:hypothetical protein
MRHPAGCVPNLTASSVVLASRATLWALAGAASPSVPDSTPILTAASPTPFKGLPARQTDIRSTLDGRLFVLDVTSRLARGLYDAPDS